MRLASVEGEGLATRPFDENHTLLGVMETTTRKKKQEAG